MSNIYSTDLLRFFEAVYTVKNKVSKFYQAGIIRDYQLVIFTNQLVIFTNQSKFYQVATLSKITRCLVIITNAD